MAGHKHCFTSFWGKGKNWKIVFFSSIFEMQATLCVECLRESSNFFKLCSLGIEFKFEFKDEILFFDIGTFFFLIKPAKQNTSELRSN